MSDEGWGKTHLTWLYCNDENFSSIVIFIYEAIVIICSLTFHKADSYLEILFQSNSEETDCNQDKMKSMLGFLKFVFLTGPQLEHVHRISIKFWNKLTVQHFPGCNFDWNFSARRSVTAVKFSHKIRGSFSFGDYNFDCCKRK